MSLEPDDLPPIDPDGTSTPPPAETTTPPPRAQCPELASVSREQLRDLLESVHHVVLGITKSTIRTDEIVQDTFEALMTTRRWNGKQPLERHVIGIAMSLLHHQHASKAPQRDARAHAGFHREIVGTSVGSPEDETLDHAEDEDRQSSARRELAELEASVAAHPVAPRVLRCKADGIEKPADIARALSIPVEHVYRATELLREHLRRIRQREKKQCPSELPKKS